MASNLFENPAIQHLLSLADGKRKLPSEPPLNANRDSDVDDRVSLSKRGKGTSKQEVVEPAKAPAAKEQSSYAVRKEKLARNKATKVSAAYQSIKEQSPIECDSLALMPYWMLASSLPYQNLPSSVQSWSRQANKNAIILQPGAYFNEGTQSNVILGYPNGKYPRLIILYLATCVALMESRAVNKEASHRSAEERTISLKGDDLLPSLLDFAFDGARTVTTSAGERGVFTLFKEQFIRLIGAHITVANTNATGSNYSLVRLNITDTAHLQAFVDSKGTAFWNMSLILSENFYAAVKTRAVPVDARIAKLLGKSPQALDVYCWLSLQAYLLNHVSQRVRRKYTWQELFSLFGPDIKETTDIGLATQMKSFKRAFTRSLSNIYSTWTGLATRVESTSEGIVLHKGIQLTVPPTKLPV